MSDGLSKKITARTNNKDPPPTIRHLLTTWRRPRTGRPRTCGSLRGHTPGLCFPRGLPAPVAAVCRQRNQPAPRHCDGTIPPLARGRRQPRMVECARGGTPAGSARRGRHTHWWQWNRWACRTNPPSRPNRCPTRRRQWVAHLPIVSCRL